MNNQFGFSSGLGTGFNQPFTGKTVNDTINNIDKWQAETKQKYSNEKTVAMENSAKNMYECAMRTNDGQVRKQNLSGANLSNMEIIIKQAAQEHGSTAYDDLGEGQILCRFLQKNPQYEQITNGTLGGDVNLKTWARTIGANSYIPNSNSINMGEKSDSSTISNIVGGAYDSATGIPRMLAKGAANAIGWAAKQLGADDEKVNSLVNDYKTYLDSDWSGESIGADKDSWTYKGTKMVGDLAQTATYGGLAKNAINSTALGKVAMDAVKQAPLVYRAAAGAIEGAADMGLYDMISESELPSGSDLAIGAGIGAISPIAGAVFKAGAKTIAPRIQLNGLLTGSKLNTLRKRLIDEGTDLAESGIKETNATEVGQWMLDRDIKGSAREMSDQLLKHADDARNLKLDTLSKSTTKHSVESAKGQLKALHEAINGKPGWESELEIVEELMSMDKHTLSQLDTIQHLTDRILKLYNKSGEVSAAIGKEGLAKLRNQTKNFIEEQALKEGLGNIKMLNNEIQIARGLEEGITSKDASNLASDILRNAIPGGIVGTAVGPFDNSTIGGKVGNFIVGMAVQKASKNAWIKTNLASKINKLSGGTKKELERWVGGEIKELTPEAQAELSKVLEGEDIARLLMVGAGESIND